MRRFTVLIFTLAIAYVESFDTSSVVDSDLIPDSARYDPDHLSSSKDDGEIALASKDDTEISRERKLEVLGLHGSNKLGFTPIIIRDTFDAGELCFYFKPEYFKDLKSSFYKKSVVLVYKDREEDDYFVSYVIKGGLSRLFAIDKPSPYNSLGAFKDFILSQDYYALTPAAAEQFAPEFYKLPLKKFFMDHIYIKTNVYLFDDTPALYIIPKRRMAIVPEALYPIAKFNVTNEGFEKIFEDKEKA